MSKYDDKDWEDLPDDIKSAAKTLGYDEAKWDGDKTPKECDKYWRQLSNDQKEAATILGYTEETWDASDSDSE